MHTIDSIIPAVEAFAARHDVLPSTVVRNATGNPRLYERLKARAAKLEEDIERISRFMADNSSVDAPLDGSPALNNEDGGAETVSQVGKTIPGDAA